MDDADSEDEVIVRVAPSAGRRLLALVVLFGLGAMLVWLAVTARDGLIGRVVLLALGVGVLIAAERMRRAAGSALILTATELRDSDGRVLALMDEIRHVDRGALAIRPSNGFILLLTEKRGAAWNPGLWWRTGRRVGVGGIAQAGATKFMAEQIALRIADRDR